MLVVISVGLRFTGLTFDSLWLDEAYQTVVESYGNGLADLSALNGQPYLFKEGKPASPHDVLNNFRSVDPLCPPLYALIINRWVTVFGGSDFALRAFSALVSIISLMVVYFLGNTLFGKRVGLCTGLVQAISPFDIAYAQEARMYSLVVLFSALSVGAFLLLSLRPKSLVSGLFALIYTFATWGLINSHYTGLFIWAFEIMVGVIFALLRKDWLLFAWLSFANLLVLELSLPWYGLFQQAVEVRTASFYVARSFTWWWPIQGLLWRVPLNWVIFLAGKRVTSPAVPIYLLAGILLVAGFRALFSSIAQSIFQKFRRPSVVDLTLKANYRTSAAALLLSWCVIPALGVWLIDLFESHRVIEISRYVIGTAPAVFLIAGIGVASLIKKKGYGICLVLLFAMFALANNAYAHIVRQREDWRQMAAVVEKLCHSDDLLFVSQYYDIVCLDRYLKHPVRQIGISPAMGQERIAQLISGHLKSKQSNDSLTSFWVLTAMEGDDVFAMIPKEFRIVRAIDLPHALHLRHYQR